MISYFQSTQTPNFTNVREHWSKRAKRAKKHRGDAKWLCKEANPPPLPVAITLTRLGVRKLDDDNLRPALKSIRDGIADAYGVEDNDPRIVWHYGQETCKRGGCGVRVKIEQTDFA